MLFTKNKQTPKQPIQDVSGTSYIERIEKLENKVRKLETDILDCLSTIDSLRNKVLRKIQERNKETDEESENQKAYKPGQAYF